MGQKNENGHIHDVFYTHIIDVVSQIVVSPKISDKKNTFSVRRGGAGGLGEEKIKTFGYVESSPYHISSVPPLYNGTNAVASQ